MAKSRNASVQTRREQASQTGAKGPLYNHGADIPEREIQLDANDTAGEFEHVSARRAAANIEANSNNSQTEDKTMARARATAATPAPKTDKPEGITSNARKGDPKFLPFLGNYTASDSHDYPVVGRRKLDNSMEFFIVKPDTKDGNKEKLAHDNGGGDIEFRRGLLAESDVAVTELPGLIDLSIALKRQSAEDKPDGETKSRKGSHGVKLSDDAAKVLADYLKVYPQLNPQHMAVPDESRAVSDAVVEAYKPKLDKFKADMERTKNLEAIAHASPEELEALMAAITARMTAKTKSA